MTLMWIRLAARVGKSQVSRNFSWMLVTYAFRAGSQVAYFVLIARALDVEEFGAFAACVAMASLVAPFATWGSGYLIVRDVSRNPVRFAVAWGNGLVVTIILGTTAAVGVSAVASLILKPSLGFADCMLIAISELIFANVVLIATQAYIAVDKHWGSALVTAAILICRLLGAAWFCFYGEGDLGLWCLVYVLASGVAAVFSFTYVSRFIGRPRFDRERARSDLVSGFHFAFSLSSQTMVNDLDKLLMARFDSLAATGIYAAAYRVVGVAFLPVFALMATLFGRFFKAGAAGGIAGSVELARKVLPFSAVMGISCSALLYLGAPIVPSLLGVEYRDSVEAIQLLSLVPFLKSLHYFAADALSGGDRQRVRMTIQICVVIFNAVSTTILIHLYSWRGASLASVMTEALLVFSMWSAALTISRREAISG